MLKMAINIGIFGAFVLIVAVLGFFLWKTLFSSEKYGYGNEERKPAYSEQKSSNEDALRTSATPSNSKSTEEAVAEYTKWLAIFTLFLVIATIGLFISGERNVEVANRSAKAAEAAAKATRDSVELASETAKRQLRAYVFANDAVVTLQENMFVAAIGVKNAGQTPAYDVKVRTQITILLPGQHSPRTCWKLTSSRTCSWAPACPQLLQPKR